MKVKLNLRERSQRGKQVRIRVAIREIGSSAKKRRFNPISRKLRWKREFAMAVRNAEIAYELGKSTFDPHAQGIIPGLQKKEGSW